jgi:hypothetical protein
MARPRSRPTMYLFRLIEAKALRESLSREELCARFNISSSYYGQLSADAALLSQASRPVIAAIAAFLEVPYVQAQLWGGQITWQDFGLPKNPGATVTQYLDRVALQIADDEHFREFGVPIKEWSATPHAIKLRYVALYEHARQLRLHKEAAGSAVGLALARAAQLKDETQAVEPAVSPPGLARVRRRQG